MIEGWRYRAVSTGGAIAATAIAVSIANHPLTQTVATTYLPLIGRLQPTVLSGSNFVLAVALSVAVVFCCLIPLYKPRPRRALDTIFLAQKRVLAALLALATIGYFNWTYRLPRATLLVVGVLLFVAIPAWFLAIRNRPSTKAGRAIVVGDDPDRIDRAMTAADLPVIGYVARPITVGAGATGRRAMADGGLVQQRIGKVDYLGGISRLEGVLLAYNVDTVVLAFENTDRGEFFGILEICHEVGVTAKVLGEHADSVLLSGDGTGDLMTVDLEPWDAQDRLFKRGFDIAFAGVGLLALSPLLLVIALAIKLDSLGPGLYSQDRTSWLGGTFRVYKFRSMVNDAEAETGAVVSAEDAGDIDPRVTKIGLILRKTHFDEIPQLWSILTGDMSVVGPRPERPELDHGIQTDGVDWERRWFVKPGLTGLAQIHEVTGFEPEKKLKLDLEYIRQQSFRFDLKIVLRQLWSVLWDVLEMLRSKRNSDRR